MGMCLVIYQFEIPEPEAEDVADIGVDPHFGEGQGLPGKLQFYLFQVVGVDVYVAAGPHEIAGPVTGDLRHHQGEQGIGSYVKGHSQENVATVGRAGRRVFLRQRKTGKEGGREEGSSYEGRRHSRR